MRKVFGSVKTIVFTLIEDTPDISSFNINGIEEMKIEENKLSIIYDANKLSAPKIISQITDIVNVDDIIIKESPIESIIENILKQ
jgi:ABC-type uncharacterized transport system ATPase subunit